MKKLVIAALMALVFPLALIADETAAPSTPPASGDAATTAPSSDSAAKSDTMKAEKKMKKGKKARKAKKEKKD